MAAFRAQVRKQRFLRWHVTTWGPMRALHHRFQHWAVVTRLERRCLSNTWRNWVSYCGSRRRSRRVVMAWLKRVDALHLMYGFARWREYVLLTTAGAVRLVRTHLPDC